jgi:hypothetical protein
LSKRSKEIFCKTGSPTKKKFRNKLQKGLQKILKTPITTKKTPKKTYGTLRDQPQGRRAHLPLPQNFFGLLPGNFFEHRSLKPGLEVDRTDLAPNLKVTFEKKERRDRERKSGRGWKNGEGRMREEDLMEERRGRREGGGME